MNLNTNEFNPSCGRHDCKDLHSWGPGIRGNYIIHYIIKGKGYYICNGKTYCVSKGQSFLVVPYKEIAYYPDRDDPWEYAWVDFDGEKYIRILEKIKAFQNNYVISELDSEIILPIFDRLLSLMGKCQNKYTIEGLVFEILGIYADHFPVVNDDEYTKIFDSCVSLIGNSFYRDDFDIQYLCKCLSISRATLHRVFKEKSEYSPGNYLKKYRIDRSKELLSHGSTVKIAAASCGFRNQLYFSKCFGLCEGVSPSDFRKRKA